MMTTSIVTWLLFYATGAKDTVAGGVGHGYFGLAMAAGRVIDALADPYVGRWSDRTNTRIGRRLPFVLGGAIPMGVIFAILWAPYSFEPPPVRALRIGITLSAFFALYTVVVCPYLAMLAEVPSPKIRMQMASWQAAGSIAGGGTVVLFSGRLFDELGFPAGGTIIAGLAVCCYLVVGLVFAREPRSEPPQAAKPPDGQEHGPLRAAWALVVEDPAFRLYLLGDAALWIGLNILSISLPYLVTAVLGLPASGVGRIGLINIAGTAMTIPFLGRLAAAFGKVRLLSASSGLLGLLLPFVALGPAGVWLLAALSGPMLACVYTLPHPILAEITDKRRARTGDGQEALHFGAQGMVLKGALAVAAWMAGVLFALLGAAPNADTGLRAAGVVAGVACLIGSALLGRVGRLLYD
jgi:GPH family glycoside/pentoside/hexuronide:cation symporter